MNQLFKLCLAGILCFAASHAGEQGQQNTLQDLKIRAKHRHKHSSSHSCSDRIGPPGPMGLPGPSGPTGAPGMPLFAFGTFFLNVPGDVGVVNIAFDPTTPFVLPLIASSVNEGLGFNPATGEVIIQTTGNYILDVAASLENEVNPTTSYNLGIIRNTNTGSQEVSVYAVSLPQQQDLGQGATFDEAISLTGQLMILLNADDRIALALMGYPGAPVVTNTLFFGTENIPTIATFTGASLRIRLLDGS